MAPFVNMHVADSGTVNTRNLTISDKKGNGGSVRGRQQTVSQTEKNPMWQPDGMLEQVNMVPVRCDESAQ